MCAETLPASVTELKVGKIMPEVMFYTKDEVEDRLLKYAVIAARYQDKWVFCRHKRRDTWEIPGGHREPDETVEETARRELWEETGAVEAEIKPVAAYRYNVDCGMLFFATISKLEDLSQESEIGEICLMECLPDKLTYPHIQRDLDQYIQGWLNLQTSSDELWDIYDEDRRLTGRTHRRGDPMKSGDYHLSVDVWQRNDGGEFLLTKRSPNKGFPSLWECTGGSALAGDDSLQTAIREVREETGLTVLPEEGRLLLMQKRKCDFKDVWLFRQNAPVEAVVLQEGETCEAKYVSAKELIEMRERGELVPLPYLEEMLREM